MNVRNYLKMAASGLTIIAAIYSLVKTEFADDVFDEVKPDKYEIVLTYML